MFVTFSAPDLDMAIQVGLSAFIETHNGLVTDVCDVASHTASVLFEFDRDGSFLPSRARALHQKSRKHFEWLLLFALVAWHHRVP